MDECCDEIIGGLVYINVALPAPNSFLVLEGIGDVMLSPSRIEKGSSVDSRGNLVLFQRAKSITCLMEFPNRCKVDPVYLFDRGCSLNITIVEKSREVRHLLSNAHIIGAPELNLSTGAVSGLQIVSDVYIRSGQSEEGLVNDTNTSGL